MVAKLTKEPTLKQSKEGEAPKPPPPMSRSTIKQAMRMKCNTIISLQRKKVLVRRKYYYLLIENFAVELWTKMILYDTVSFNHPSPF